jgi:hypothetical protein
MIGLLLLPLLLFGGLSVVVSPLFFTLPFGRGGLV